MKKTIILVVICLFIVHGSIISADMILPGFYEKKCESYEQRIECYKEECWQYKGNSRYRLLVASAKGMHVYCYDPLLTPQPKIYSIVLGSFYSLLLTLAIEISIFLLAGFNKKKELLVFTIANIISVPFVNYLVAISSGAYLIYVLFLAETSAVFFESFALHYFNKKLKLRKVLVVVTLANLASFAFGYLLFFRLLTP